MELNKVKSLAAKVMKTGKKRIKIIHPEEAREVMTRQDVKEKIKEGVIVREQKKGTSRGRARKKQKQKKRGRKKGKGRRKGAKEARRKSKDEWVEKVRAQRKKLKKIKPQLKEGAYQKLYRKIKGNTFKSKKQLMNHIKEKKLMKGDNDG